MASSLGLTVFLVVGLQLFSAGIVESGQRDCKFVYQSSTVTKSYSFNGLPLLVNTVQSCQADCDLYPACIGLQFFGLRVKIGFLTFSCALIFNQLSYYSPSELSVAIGETIYNRVTVCDDTDKNSCATSPCGSNGKCTTFENGYRCDCNPGFTGVNCQTASSDTCAAVLKANPNAASGIYTLYLASFGKTIQAYCDMTTNGGGWTVIQRRKDGTVDFNGKWETYKNGFGNSNGEFWIGNEIIAALTSTPQLLRIELGNKDGKRVYEQYDNFQVAGSTANYKMTVGAFSGDAGDSLSSHSSNMFSTSDKDNDQSSSNCAADRSGAWWFNKCHDSNLNGKYAQDAAFGAGINWAKFGGYTGSLTFAEMKIRPMN